jgi:hypothetical protein
MFCLNLGEAVENYQLSATWAASLQPGVDPAKTRALSNIIS